MDGLYLFLLEGSRVALLQLQQKLLTSFLNDLARVGLDSLDNCYDEVLDLGTFGLDQRGLEAQQSWDDEHGVLTGTRVRVFQTTLDQVVEHVLELLRQLDVRPYAFVRRLSHNGFRAAQVVDESGYQRPHLLLYLWIGLHVSHHLEEHLIRFQKHLYHLVGLTLGSCTGLRLVNLGSVRKLVEGWSYEAAAEGHEEVVRLVLVLDDVLHELTLSLLLFEQNRLVDLLERA